MTTRRVRARNAIQKRTLSLKTPLTDDEVLAYADRASRQQSELASKILALGAHQKAAKAEISEIERDRNNLLQRVREKAEDRDVDCEITYHWREDKVTTKRLDTGEIVRERPMNFDERQAHLFDVVTGADDEGAAIEGSTD